MINPWFVGLFPLVNLGTQVLKTFVYPKVPRWLLPLVNVGIGTGLVWAASKAGLSADQVVPPDFLNLIVQGSTVGGAATKREEL